jgi:hypothetical protein
MFYESDYFDSNEAMTHVVDPLAFTFFTDSSKIYFSSLIYPSLNS